MNLWNDTNMPMQNAGRNCKNKKSFNNYKQSISLAMLSNGSDARRGLVHQRTVLKANTAHSKVRKH